MLERFLFPTGYSSKTVCLHFDLQQNAKKLAGSKSSGGKLIKKDSRYTLQNELDFSNVVFMSLERDGSF